MADQKRNRLGRFAKNKLLCSQKRDDVVIQHNYCVGNVFEGAYQDSVGKHIDREGWKHGRRVVGLGVLLESLRYCGTCRLGPIRLCYYNIVGELKKGLGGFLYVRCENPDCRAVNRVPYGKTHRQSPVGMPCFSVNTKLGTAMIDSVGGAVRVNNFLSTLNVPTISNKNLKHMETRAGEVVEKVGQNSARVAAKESFKSEMRDVSKMESMEAEKSMDGFFEELGIAAMPDSSPRLKQILALKNNQDSDSDSEWTDVEDEVPDLPPRKQHFQFDHSYQTPRRPKKNLAAQFPCRTRKGMSCAVDTAWQKRGFDSLTSHTFFMSKAKYGKKVVKSVVSHRTCGKCRWWARNKPGQPVRKHQCVQNHSGSVRLMESVSGIKGMKDLQQEGTPVEYLEGDGDTTLMARLREDYSIPVKKRFDKNHVIKNFGKHLRALKSDKKIKISQSVIDHLQKCVSYAFAKNAGDKDGLAENLKAIVPHQFGDHSSCKGRFCGYVRKSGEKYIHKSLPYKLPLNVNELRNNLDKLLEPLINNPEQYADLGSSQQCEHANREVSIRAPKSFHYGNSKSLDYHVHATAAFINEGRHYIPKVNAEAGLSPGLYTVKYAEKCEQQRKRMQTRTLLPSCKRRRLILKKERAVSMVAQETLEGASYQSGIGHQDNVDIEKIPDPVSNGNFKPVHLTEQPTVIAFDLETTDLIRSRVVPQITQIAAVEMNSGKNFNQYIIPTVPISSSAQQITGMVMNGTSLKVNGKPVDSLPVKEALDSFFSWINSFGSVLLVAHNGRRFDFPVLMKAMTSVGYEERLFSCVKEFVDSLPLFQKSYPGRKTYKQEELASDLLNIVYGAHDAIEDVKVLGKLLENTSSALSPGPVFTKDHKIWIKIRIKINFSNILKNSWSYVHYFR